MATTGHQAEGNGQVVGTVGSGPLMASVKPAVPVTVLAPGGIGVGVGPRALAGFHTLFLAFPDPLTMRIGASADGSTVPGDDEAMGITKQALLGGRDDEDVPEDLLEQGFRSSGKRLAPAALDALNEALDDPGAIGCQYEPSCGVCGAYDAGGDGQPFRQARDDAGSRRGYRHRGYQPGRSH